MAASAWTVFNEFKARLGAAALNLSTDTFKIALFTSAASAQMVASLATAHYATLGNQVAQANGYTTGGQTCARTWTESSGTVTFDVADAQWSASGGPITARYAVLYDDTSADKDLVAFTTLDTTPADVTATDGNTFTVQINAAGVFTMA